MDSDEPTTCTYTVKVQVWDGLDTHGVEEDSENPTVDDTITVTINVRDVDEAPAGADGDRDGALGQYDPERDLGPSPRTRGPIRITYDVQYREGGAFSNDNCVTQGEDGN